MESIQSIKGRIASIRGTRQITQSMRLVSTAKVQRSRSRMADNQPFTQGVRKLAAEAAAGQAGSSHPFLTGREAPAAILLISSDRGLCGGYNVNVCRKALSLAGELGDCRLAVVGRKARDFCKRNGLEARESYLGVSESPLYQDAVEIGNRLLDWYESGEAGSLYLVYTRFRTLLAQTPRVERLLPLDVEALGVPGGMPPRFEPDGLPFFQRAVPFYVHGMIYGAMLESASCEQAARITSMDSAVKNADGMIERLSLLYNRARQDAITQEMTEIVGGAEALAGEGEG